MTRLAVLAAILIIMGFTPLGYLKLNPVMTITFNMIPVVVGAVILGPEGGAILGIIFGLTSFSQALTGSDLLGTAILNSGGLNACRLFLTCVVSRFFAGWIPGLFFKALDRGAKGSKRVVLITLAALCGSVANTLFFVGNFILYFADNAIINDAFGTTSVWKIITILITLNALVEMIVCTVVGGGVGHALAHYLPVKPAKDKAEGRGN